MPIKKIVSKSEQQAVEGFGHRCKEKKAGTPTSGTFLNIMDVNAAEFSEAMPGMNIASGA